MKTISVVTPCFNEEGNVREVYERVRDLMLSLGKYRYEHIFIDNASRDATFTVLSEIAAADANVKVIRNARNFGHVRSPMHALFQAQGDAVVVLMSDLQDPPEVLVQLIEQWERGVPIVIAVKQQSHESAPMLLVRKAFYRLVNRLSDDIETYENFTGFGLYDRKVIELVRQFGDPYPYFRGMIAEIGLPHSEVRYVQQRRKSGKTKNNFYTLYDLAMLGITKLSKVPLRMVTFSGFAGSLLSLFGGMAYFLYKLFFWKNFTVGIAPIAIGMFFLGSLQLLFMGIIGEYIGNIHTQVHNRPLVIERERLNFQFEPGIPLPRHALVSGAAAGSAQ
ncbi:MAG TPA: glycosyltransferase family 2 protein [Terriglobales bacterium]|jgi:glycosyltransferase involved in cell wall biosynthesis|nr:glycosyltransferase family 2 protein [Terriglobales bacterium]